MTGKRQKSFVELEMPGEKRWNETTNAVNILEVTWLNRAKPCASRTSQLHVRTIQRVQKESAKAHFDVSVVAEQCGKTTATRNDYKNWRRIAEVCWKWRLGCTQRDGALNQNSNDSPCNSVYRPTFFCPTCTVRELNTQFFDRSGWPNVDFGREPCVWNRTWRQ